MVLTITLMCICTLASILLLWRDRFVNPLVLFIAYSFIFYAGCLPHLDLRSEADSTHLFAISIYFLTILMYVIFGYSWRRNIKLASIWGSRSLPDFRSECLGRVLCLFTVSILISIIYYKFLVGYNLFSLALQGADEDYTTLRLASYAGDQYNGAGIVNQFKNTMLPVTYFALFVILRGRMGRTGSFIALLALPIFLWCILGTGQRTFLFLSFAGLFLYLLYAGSVPIITMIGTTVGMIWLFSLYSVLLGRSDGGSAAEAVQQLVYRLFAANQFGSVEGFRYIYEKPTQGGAELLRSLVGFIPGVKGSTLSNEVHAYVFGSIRGTIPPSLIGSLYHNFGLIGVPFGVVLVMKFIETSRRVFLRLDRTRVNTMIMAFYFMYLGIMPATGPAQIFNNGVFAIIFMIIYFSIHVRWRR